MQRKALAARWRCANDRVASVLQHVLREQLMDGVKRLRIGHLLSLLHFGSMPTELCKKNIDLFAREVLPHLESLWDDQYEDRWWPERLKVKRQVAAMAAAS